MLHPAGRHLDFALAGTLASVSVLVLACLVFLSVLFAVPVGRHTLERSFDLVDRTHRLLDRGLVSLLGELSMPRVQFLETLAKLMNTVRSVFLVFPIIAARMAVTSVFTVLARMLLGIFVSRSTQVALDLLDFALDFSRGLLVAIPEKFIASSA